MLGRILGGGSTDLLSSKLFDHETFYSAFNKDLMRCRSELVIESPFLTSRRVGALLPMLKKLKRRGVSVTINTKPIHEHDDYLHTEAELSVSMLQEFDVQILFTGGHHRKLAIMDRAVLWEGSLNILSQNDSCEVMRRIESEALARQMISFAKLDRFLALQ